MTDRLYLLWARLTTEWWLLRVRLTPASVKRRRLDEASARLREEKA